MAKFQLHMNILPAILAALLAAVFVCLVAMPVLAQQTGTNPYKIDGFEVTLESKQRPAQARAMATEKATKQGFSQLLKRLTAQSAWPRHEEILAKADMNRVIDRYNIVREETDPEYTAVFDISFNRDYVRNLLSRLSVPFSEVGAGPVLLLPVLDLSNRQLLWEETNPWRAKLEQAAKGAGLVRFVLPVGDPQEIMMLTPEMVAFGAGDMIMSVAENYNAEAAVVARFQMGMTPAGQREALLDLTWYGGQGVPPKYLQIPLQSEEGLDAAMATVAEKAILSVEEAWRQLYMVDFERPGQTLLHYAPTNAGTLSRTREALTQIPIVDSVLLRMASAGKAILQVNYFGTDDKLKALAGERDITLAEWNGKTVISLGSNQANTDAYGVRSTMLDNRAIFNGNTPANSYQTPPQTSKPAEDQRQYEGYYGR